VTNLNYCKEITQEEVYDVLVLGGGPAGVCAAVSAARCGASVLLVERLGVLGGMLTAGRVDPILGDVAPGTMYDELVRLFAENHPACKMPVTRNGKEVLVDPEEAKTILINWVLDNGVTLYLQTTVIDILKEGDTVQGAVLATPTGLMAVKAKCVVDATGDGFACAMADAEYKIGRESDGHCQPTTLEFVLEGVDEERAITCWGGSDPVCLPGGKRYADFCKEANQRGELPTNVSIVRLHRTPYAGERSVNATQSNGRNTLSPKGITSAIGELRNQVDVVAAFLQKNVPGYEKCRVKATADVLGVRETRRIMGHYVLQDSDVEQGARFDDAVVHKAWFLIDIHNPTGGGQAEKHSQPAVPYDIPYRCFVPLKVENLLMAGRCISGTHRAHASYRVMAICMAMGEAVGVAAALSAQQNKTPKDVAASDVQNVLQKRGVVLFDA
jgi:hypothetical protein